MKPNSHTKANSPATKHHDKSTVCIKDNEMYLLYSSFSHCPEFTLYDVHSISKVNFRSRNSESCARSGSDPGIQTFCCSKFCCFCVTCLECRKNGWKSTTLKQWPVSFHDANKSSVRQSCLLWTPMKQNCFPEQKIESALVDGCLNWEDSKESETGRFRIANTQRCLTSDTTATLKFHLIPSPAGLNPSHS